MQYSVLIVDDEENVLKALKRELESPGAYRITTFKSPEVALIQAQNIHYDLLITDYKMPWMHGLTFIKRFMRLQPHITTIIITGDAKGALRHGEFDDIEIPYLLQKPWQQSELLEMVAQALE
jgi:DNA-binding NtrC family response regulator